MVPPAASRRAAGSGAVPGAAPSAVASVTRSSVFWAVWPRRVQSGQRRDPTRMGDPDGSSCFLPIPRASDSVGLLTRAVVSPPAAACFGCHLKAVERVRRSRCCGALTNEHRGLRAGMGRPTTQLFRTLRAGVIPALDEDSHVTPPRPTTTRFPGTGKNCRQLHAPRQSKPILHRGEIVVAGELDSFPESA